MLDRIRRAGAEIWCNIALIKPNLSEAGWTSTDLILAMVLGAFLITAVASAYEAYIYAPDWLRDRYREWERRYGLIISASAPVTLDVYCPDAFVAGETATVKADVFPQMLGFHSEDIHFMEGNTELCDAILDGKVSSCTFRVPERVARLRVEVTGRGDNGPDFEGACSAPVRQLWDILGIGVLYSKPGYVLIGALVGVAVTGSSLIVRHSRRKRVVSSIPAARN